MAYIGSKPADKVLTASDITDGVVSNAKLAQDIISADTALASEPADTDEFLVSDAGTLKRIDYSLIKGGGCWEKLDTITISGTTSQIEHEEANFTSTHKDYKIIFSGLTHTVGGGASIYMRIAGDGASLLSTTHYLYATTSYKSNDNTNNQYDLNDTKFKIGGTSTAGTTTQTHNFEINICDPLNTATYQHISAVGELNDDNGYPMTLLMAGHYGASASTAMKRFALYLSSGDWNGGTSTLYGRIV
jgi:hypothetical protein